MARKEFSKVWFVCFFFLLSVFMHSGNSLVLSKEISTPTPLYNKFKDSSQKAISMDLDTLRLAEVLFANAKILQLFGELCQVNNIRDIQTIVGKTKIDEQSPPVQISGVPPTTRTEYLYLVEGTNLTGDINNGGARLIIKSEIIRFGEGMMSKYSYESDCKAFSKAVPSK